MEYAEQFPELCTVYNCAVLVRVVLVPVVSCFYSVSSSVVVRGSHGDEAVLCTRDMTFELRAADTSNSLLIAPSLNLPRPQGISEGSGCAFKTETLSKHPLEGDSEIVVTIVA